MDNLFSKTIKAGLLVGTLDISAALLQYFIKTGKNPANVLIFIASAVFGKDAFSGGNKMILFGLLFHFGVAYTFTLFFFLIYQKIYTVLRNNILAAVLYGSFMWAVMQYLVLPLTSAPILTVTVKSAITAIAILILCMGIPLSFITAKYYSKRL